MNRQITLGARARRLIVITMLLALTGAGAAAAYWTVTTQLSASTSAASVGLEQQLLPAGSDSPLTATYTAESPSAAGTIALTNTGSRAAEYALTVKTSSASAEDLPAALQLTAGLVEAGQECAAGSDLKDLRTGALPLEIAGTLIADETVDVCLQTEFAAEDIVAFADEQIVLAVSSSLTYAEGDDWTVGAEPVTITQTVGPHESAEPGEPGDPQEPGGPEKPETPGAPGGGDFTSDAARYQLSLDGACVQLTHFDSIRGIALHANCGQWESEWRVTDAGDGTFHIDWANNETPGMLQQTRWTATGAGRSVTLSDAATGNDAQRWNITAVSESQHRFESVAYPGHYLTVGGGLWNAGDANPRRLILEPSVDHAIQGIGFERIGDPFREVEQMSGSGNEPWHVDLTFSQNTGYEKEISYRVFLAREDTPDVRVAYPQGALEGAYPTVQLNRDSGLREYVNSADGGVGNTWVHVEQKLPGGDWTPAAVGKVHITPTTPQDQSVLGVHNGWQE